MFEILKKTMLTGIGLGLMTRDKVEEVARDIANSANLSADKGQEFVNEAVARAQKSRVELDDRIRAAIDDALSKTNLATKEDIARVEERLGRIEQITVRKPE